MTASDRVETITTDVLVIGSGGSGLRAAIEADSRGAGVVVVAKEAFADAHTAWAMGGVNVAIKAPATPEQHFQDTIRGGWFINNHRMARIMSEEMPARIADLESYGVRFDRLPDGTYFTWASGKQSAALNLCAGDHTGREMMQGLIAEVGRRRIRSLDHHHVARLLRRGGAVAGALVIDMASGGYKVINAKTTIVATGGGGAMYRVNTNAPSNTGEGYAWGLDVGAELVDMEMVQFHPTGMAVPPERRGALVTEKVRGNGGILKNCLGERFMQRYQPERLELAGRDEVTRAIYAEVQEGRGTGNGAVYLDVTHWDDGRAEQLIPDVFAAHMDVGIDIRTEMMEITPTMHHMMGGYVIDEWGATGVPGLLAVGEVTTTIHGANRLGGNSLAEGQVFGRRAGIRAAEAAERCDLVPIPAAEIADQISAVEAPLGRREGRYAEEILQEIKTVMWNQVGIIRDGQTLLAARGEIERLKGEATSLRADDRGQLLACLEVADMLATAEAIVASALVRTESRGAHFRSDHPDLDPEWQRNIRVARGADGRLITRVVEVSTDEPGAARG